MDVHVLAARWREFASAAGDALEQVDSMAWSRQTAYPGWTAHDLLAHISSTQKALPRLVESAFGPTPPSPLEPFDPDRWNASQVRRRRDQPSQGLIEEFRQGAVELASTIEEQVRPEDLARPVPLGAGRGHALGESLEELFEHQRGHLSDLLQSVRSSID